MHPITKAVLEAGKDPTQPVYGDITQHYDKYGDGLHSATYLVLSLGLGNDKRFGDITQSKFDLRKYGKVAVQILSLGYGNDEDVHSVHDVNPEENCIYEFMKVSRYQESDICERFSLMTYLPRIKP